MCSTVECLWLSLPKGGQLAAKKGKSGMIVFAVCGVRNHGLTIGLNVVRSRDYGSMIDYFLFVPVL